MWRIVVTYFNLLLLARNQKKVCPTFLFRTVPYNNIINHGGKASFNTYFVVTIVLCRVSLSSPTSSNSFNKWPNLRETIFQNRSNQKNSVDLQILDLISKYTFWISSSIVIVYVVWVQKTTHSYTFLFTQNCLKLTEQYYIVTEPCLIPQNTGYTGLFGFICTTTMRDLKCSMFLHTTDLTFSIITTFMKYT